LLHFGFINLYSDDEITKSMPRDPSGPTHKYPIQKIYCSLLDHAGPKRGKALALYYLGALFINISMIRRKNGLKKNFGLLWHSPDRQ